MTSSPATATWGISGPHFLIVYAALAVLAAAVARIRWRTVFGPSRHTNDPTPKLAPYKIAILTGGPRLAVLAASTKLLRDGTLVAGPRRSSLRIARDLPADADPFDREIHDAVGRDPGLTVDTLRGRLADSPTLRTMMSELEDSSLLADRRQTAALRRDLLILGAVLAAVGLARIAAGGAMPGEPIAVLTIAVVAVGLAIGRLARPMPYATGYGDDLLRRLRRDRRTRLEAPHAAESVTAIALFGSGALWLADPSAAAALGVPRESAGTRASYASCGGDGAGGWFGGGHGGSGHGGGLGGGHGGGHAGCGGHGGCGGGH